MCTSEPFLLILCDTLFRRSKLIFFIFESAATCRFLYMNNALLSHKMLLNLIHFKSFNIRVTWSHLKYFPLIVTFSSKLIHFCILYCSFSLHLPHIDLKWFRLEKITFIRSILDFRSSMFFNPNKTNEQTKLLRSFFNFFDQECF